MAARTFNLSVILTAIDNLTAPLKKTGKKLAAFSDKAARASAKLKGAGDAMTRNITLPLAGIGAISSKIAIGFDDSMRQVQAITSATAQDFELLKASALDLGKKTKFTASEAAQGMKFLGMAGFDTTQILKAMPGVLDLAAASGVELAEASDMMSDAMSMFHINADQANRVSDVMAKVTNRSNTNMSQLFEALKFIGPTVANMGASIEEVSAVIGILGDNGLKGSVATRALSTAFTKLADPSKTALQLMKSTNVQAFDANGKFKGLTSVLEQVQRATADMSDEQKSFYISSIFGSEALKSVNILLNAEKKVMVDNEKVTKKGVDALRAFTGELDNAKGTAKKMANVMESGPGGALRRMKSAVEGMAISIGNILAPMIVKITKKIVSFTKWFDNLSPKTKKMIVKFGLLAAAIGPALIVMSKLVGAVGMVSKAISFLIANPIVLIIAAIIAVVVILVVLLKKWEKKTQGVSRAWARMVKIGKKIFELFKRLPAPIKYVIFAFNPFLLLPALIIKNWEKVKAFFAALGDFFKNVDWEGLFFGFFNVIDEVLAKIEALFNKIDNIKQSVGSFVGGGVAKVKGLAGKAAEAGGAAIEILVRSEDGSSARVSKAKTKNGVGSLKIKTMSFFGRTMGAFSR